MQSQKSVDNSEVPFTLGNLADMGANGLEVSRALAVLNGYRAKIDGMPCGECRRTMYAVVTSATHSDQTRLPAAARTFICDLCRNERAAHE